MLSIEASIRCSNRPSEESIWHVDSHSKWCLHASEYWNGPYLYRAASYKVVRLLRFSLTVIYKKAAC